MHAGAATTASAAKLPLADPMDAARCEADTPVAGLMAMPASPPSSNHTGSTAARPKAQPAASPPDSALPQGSMAGDRGG